MRPNFSPITLVSSPDMNSSASSSTLEPLRHNKRDKPAKKENSRLFVLWLLGITTILCCFIFYAPKPFRVSYKQEQPTADNIINHSEYDYGDCDLFDGIWIPNLDGPLYSNRSCVTIPESKNCGKYGRKDVDYLNWRWKPYGCELPRFDANTFLSIVRGKTLAFIGDSVARNHMESLLCLLSQGQKPVDMLKDTNIRSRTWYFPSHDFTLKFLWTKFFVIAEERMINGTGAGVYEMHIDKVDNNWAEKLPGIHYAILSNAHWFFRPIYLYEHGKVKACVHCDENEIHHVSPGFAIQRAFGMAFKSINNCKKCGNMLTVLRTFSPAHFEGGAWNTGGRCNKTSLYREENVTLGGSELEFRTIQVTEIERAQKKGANTGKRYRVLDVTKAMLMRPDGHPDVHWNNKLKKGYSDCIHWCLPGPVDVWNDLLMAVMRLEDDSHT